MEHHDLAHRRLRIWPLDQTSLGHHHLCCAIHHKQAPGAHSAHRLHKKCGQSFKCSTYSVFLLHHFLQNMCSFKHNEKIINYYDFFISLSSTHICSTWVLPWCQPHNVAAVKQHLVTTELWQYQCVSQFTPAPRYTSGCVFSHHCQLKDSQKLHMVRQTGMGFKGAIYKTQTY